MKKAILKVFAILTVFSPSAVFAQNPPQLAEGLAIIGNVFGIVMPVGQILAVAMVVYGGYMWMISGGDPSKIQQAQGTLTWAVLGLVFLSIFRIIFNMIFNFLLG